MDNPDFNSVSGLRIRHAKANETKALPKHYARLIPDTLTESILLNNLAGQGVKSRHWKRTLESTSKDMPQAFALKDSKQAAQLFVSAVEKLGPERKIAIWGDYDADGNMSSVELGLLARQLRPDAKDFIEHYIPHRSEGYGLNLAGIDALAAKGVKTLFTVDTGTVAYEAIAHARALGMEVAVLDHHQPRMDEPLPKGALIVNPHRRDQKKAGSLRDLAASGVAWLFAHDVIQLLKEQGKQDQADAIDTGMLTVAAGLGTIPDVVSLQSPLNRLIVKRSLEEINSGRYPAIESLKGLSGIKIVSESNIAFLFGPYLNASGRMDDPTVGMRLLLADTQVAGEDLAKRLQADNDERKQFSNHIILRDAQEKARSFFGKHPDAPLLMVDDAHWLGGVVGIVASRLKEQYTLPVLAGARWRGKDGADYITYSARSIEGANLYQQLTQAFRDLPKGDVVKFGGHAMAAGLTIRADAEERVFDAMAQALGASVKQARAQTSITVAGEVTPDELTVERVRQLFAHGSFGAKITPPRLIVRNVQVKHMREMGDEGEHLRISLGAPDAAKPHPSLAFGTAFRAAGTKLGDLLQDPDRHNQAFDAVIEPYIFQRSNGEDAVGFHLVDASPARTVSQSPAPQDILRAHSERMETFKAQQVAEVDRIKSLPYKMEYLLDPKAAEKDGKTAETQAVLEQLYKAKISFLDTETTGLDIAHPEYGKTNGLTQIAVMRVVKNGKNSNAHYEIASKLFPILPLTPAYFEYERMAARAKKSNLPPPPYDQKRCEYAISPGAKNVTGIGFRRDREDGPIKGMEENGHDVKGARPLYEVAGDVLAFLDDTVPYAFNTSFDARGLVKQFNDVLAAREPIDSKSPHLHIQIHDDGVREDYRTLTDPVAEKLGTRIDGQTPGPFSHYALSANYPDTFLGALWDKGEKSSNRLDSVAPDYGVAFTRSDTAHNALEDILPLPYVLSQQMKRVARKRYDSLTKPALEQKHPDHSQPLLQKLESTPFALKDLYELMVRESDPGASVESGFIENVKKPKARSKASKGDEPEENTEKTVPCSAHPFFRRRKRHGLSGPWELPVGACHR